MTSASPPRPWSVPALPLVYAPAELGYRDERWQDIKLVKPFGYLASAVKGALVGFQGSGKTSVFNALTGQSAATGFGKKGSNDTQSPMPAADRPPIQLSQVELDAVLAFMQSKDGNPVTVALPSEAPGVAPAPRHPP